MIRKILTMFLLLSATAMADVKVRVGRAAAATATGNQSFTISGFGTPKAAILIMMKGTTDATAVVDGIFSMGITDGTNQRAVGHRNEDNTADVTANSRSTRDEVIIFLDGAADTVDCEANFNAWVTDGIQVTWGAACDAAYLVTYILFTGSDLSAHVSGMRHRNTASAVTEISRLSGTCTNVGTADSGGSGETRVDVSGTPFSATDEGNMFFFTTSENSYLVAEYIDTNTVDLLGDASAESDTDTFRFDGPDFQSDVLILVSGMVEPNDTTVVDTHQMLGFVKRAGTIIERSLSLDANDAQAVGSPAAIVTDVRSYLGFDASTIGAQASVTAFDSTGFDVTTDTTGTNRFSEYLALSFNGAVGFNVWTFNPPTTGGNSDDTGPGFTPQFYMYGASHCQTINVAEGDQDGGAFGVMAGDTTNQYTNEVVDEDAAARSDTSSLSRSGGIALLNDDKSAGQAAAYVDVTASGITWNWVDVKDPTTQWIGLAIEEYSAVSGIKISPEYRATNRADRLGG